MSPEKGVFRKGYFRVNQTKRQRGVSFFEVLITAVILTTGLIVIYRSFFVSLDYQTHCVNRLNAIMLLDDHLARMQRKFDPQKGIPFDEEGITFNLVLNNRPVPFHLDMDFQSEDNMENMLRCDLVLSWPERGRTFRLKRSAYFF